MFMCLFFCGFILIEVLVVLVIVVIVLVVVICVVGLMIDGNGLLCDKLLVLLVVESWFVELCLGVGVVLGNSDFECF